MSREEQVTEIVRVFIDSLTSAQLQALGLVIMDITDHGQCIMEDETIHALCDRALLLSEEMKDFPECEKCEGNTRIAGKTCSKCKGVGLFDPEMPQAAFAVNSEMEIVSQIYMGQVDVIGEKWNLVQEILHEVKMT